MKKRRITLHDIKAALLDERFRKTLPDTLTSDVQKFLNNPGCACNHSIYLNVMRKAQKQVKEYFPTQEAPTEKEIDKQFEKVMKNEWQVINCSIHELSKELRKLGTGRKQLDVARYEDQVTVVVNHLDYAF